MLVYVFLFFLKRFILSPLFFDGKTGSKAWYFYLFLRIAVWYMNTLHIIMANILCRIWSMSYVQSSIVHLTKNDTTQKHGNLIFFTLTEVQFKLHMIFILYLLRYVLIFHLVTANYTTGLLNNIYCKKHSTDLYLYLFFIDSIHNKSLRLQ